MIHSNNYIENFPNLENSGRINLKLNVDQNPPVLLLMGADNANNPGNTVQITFSTPVPYEDVVNNYIDRFVPGADLPRITLRILINDVDYADYLIGQLNITWGEDNNGTCSFSLSNVRPFASIPISSSNSDVKVGNEIVIKSNTVLGDYNYVHTIFTGNIVNFDYDMWEDTLSVECLDKSYNISRKSDRISQEFFNVDPFFTEKISPVNISTNYVTYKLSREFDIGSVKEVISGLWQESDSQLKSNLATRQGTIEKVFKLSKSGTNYYLYISRTESKDSLKTVLTNNVRQTFIVRYALHQNEIDKILSKAVKKSVLIEQVARISGITSLINKRKDFSEDELNTVSLTANNEFPLDFIRKISIPQTWISYFDEFGNLIIDRHKLLSSAEKIFTDDNILAGTLKLTQDLDNVINVQEVAGITVVRPGNSTPTTDTPVSPIPISKSCKPVLLKSVTITGGSNLTVKYQDLTTTQLSSQLKFYHDQIDSTILDLKGGIFNREGISFKLSYNGSPLTPKGIVTSAASLLHYGTKDSFGNPTVLLSAVSMKVGNAAYAAGISVFSGSTPTARTQYGLSFSGLPSYAIIIPNCITIDSPCIACGGGTYALSPDIKTSVGIAITIVPPIKYVYENINDITFSFSSFSATLEIWNNVEIP